MAFRPAVVPGGGRRFTRCGDDRCAVSTGRQRAAPAPQGRAAAEPRRPARQPQPRNATFPARTFRIRGITLRVHAGWVTHAKRLLRAAGRRGARRAADRAAARPGVRARSDRGPRPPRRRPAVRVVRPPPAAPGGRAPGGDGRAQRTGTRSGAARLHPGPTDRPTVEGRRSGGLARGRIPARRARRPASRRPAVRTPPVPRAVPGVVRRFDAGAPRRVAELIGSPSRPHPSGRAATDRLRPPSASTGRPPPRRRP